MRKSFERSIEQYREVAQDFEKAKKPDTEPLDVVAVEQELEFMFARNAKANLTETDTQSAVFETQRYKQEIMTALHEELKRIDAKEQREVGEGQRFVRMEGEEIVWDQGDGKTMKMTLGELLTDGEWGVEYVLDVESMPREVQKKYVVGEAKRQLLSLLNEQLVLAETGRSDVHPDRARAFEGNLDLDAKRPKPGFVAERGVGNFLKKLSIDLGVDIEVVDATVYHDVVQKVDFMVKIGSKNRGVDVEVHDEQFIGFQFTTDMRWQTERIKKKMIKRAKNKYLDSMPVDDILLVAVPMREESSAHYYWETGGKLPGGPDGYWSTQVRELITRHIFAGVDSNVDVDEIIAKLPAARKVKKVSRPAKTSKEQQLNEVKKQETVFGAEKYYVCPELLLVLAGLSKDTGVNLQGVFQERLNDLDGDVTPKRMLKMLNKVLRHNGLEKIDHMQPGNFPPGLESVLSKFGSVSNDVNRFNHLVSKLFPQRRVPQKKNAGKSK